MSDIKKFLVIGKPINHSMSPQLHNYWIKKGNINAIYNKQELNKSDLKDLVIKITNREINGVNITVPFKKEIIPHVDELSRESENTQSVNTISFKNGKTVGHNTDIVGFEKAVKDTGYNFTGKRVLILGAGGVVPSIIFALQRLKVANIMLSNRTKSKAKDIKNFYETSQNDEYKISVIDWGELPDFDIVINATSIGLKSEEKLDLDFSKVGNEKFFYDVIYNPKETHFLKTGKTLGNKTENGKNMFIYQAAEAFKIWHNIEPEINEDVKQLIDQ